MIDYNQPLENTFNKFIYDNIYGFIYLNQSEKELLSTKYFQRLHFIKQLGVSDFVFPGATHTRYSHSLGVLYITEKIIQRIKKIDPNMIDSRLHQLVRLAALLHDIGHYPLSHTIEKSYFLYDSYKGISDLESKDPILISKIKENELDSLSLSLLLNEYQGTDKEKTVFNHENVAGIIIQNTDLKDFLLEKFSLEMEYKHLEIISNLIKGESFFDFLINEEGDPDEWQLKLFLVGQVINSYFDADQIDYMVRDSQNTGINASIDVDYIINNLVISSKTFSTIRGDKEYKTISFNIEALQSIEQFLLAKYYWYTNILYYDKTFILNLIAERVYFYLLLKNDSECKIPIFSNKNDFINFIQSDNFIFFNDNFFWNELIKFSHFNKKIGIIAPLVKLLIHKHYPKLTCNKLSFGETKPKNMKLDIRNEELYIEIKQTLFKYSQNNNEIIKLLDPYININEERQSTCKPLQNLPDQLLSKFLYKSNESENEFKCMNLYISRKYELNSSNNSDIEINTHTEELSAATV